MEAQPDAVQPGKPVPPPVIDPTDPDAVTILRDRLRKRQNPALGILAGTGAMTVGVVLWTVLTVVTRYRLGWLSIGVGFMTAYAIRLIGKGVDTYYGIAAIVLMVIACAAGSLTTAVSIFAIKGNTPFMEILTKLSPADAFFLARAAAGPMNLLLYAIAIALAFYFAFTHVSRENFHQLVRKLK